MHTHRYMATGGADAMVTIWDLNELVCVRTLDKHEYVPVCVFGLCDRAVQGADSECLVQPRRQPDRFDGRGQQNRYCKPPICLCLTRSRSLRWTPAKQCTASRRAVSSAAWPSTPRPCCWPTRAKKAAAARLDSCLSGASLRPRDDMIRVACTSAQCDADCV